MAIKTYETPIAFKKALDDRFKTALTPGRDLERLRQLLVYDRFLARIVAEFGDAVVLKGGLVLELRLRKARMTKDVDIRFSGDPKQLLDRLQRAGRAPLPDFMSFEVTVDPKHPDIHGEGTKYDGKRFAVTCQIAGKPYGRPFGLDVCIGDPMIGEPELVTAIDRLAFIGVEPPTLRIYPIETHLAEKLHAYTMPRETPNSRVKDLPDIALISEVGRMDANRVHEALLQTFTFRDTHDVPSGLPRPPDFWHAVYEQKAADFDLQWKTLEACYEHACGFLNPVLAGNHAATWDPTRGAWIQR